MSSVSCSKRCFHVSNFTRPPRVLLEQPAAMVESCRAGPSSRSTHSAVTGILHFECSILTEHQIFWIDLHWVGSGDSAAGSYCADRSSNEFYCKNRRMGGFLSKAMGVDWEGFFLLILVKRFPCLGVSLTSAQRSFFLETWISMLFVLYRLHLCCVCCT